MKRDSKNRRVDLLVYDSLYTIKGNKYGDCTYCGIPSETLDHIPPISHVQYFSDKAKDTFSFFKIPSCLECNSALNSLTLYTVAERKHYIKKHITKKYKKALRVPYWDEEELKELHPTMREEIRKANKQSSWVKERITWMPTLDLYNLSCYPNE